MSQYQYERTAEDNDRLVKLKFVELLSESMDDPQIMDKLVTKIVETPQLLSKFTDSLRSQRPTRSEQRTEPTSPTPEPTPRQGKYSLLDIALGTRR